MKELIEIESGSRNIEGFSLQSFGARSTNAKYILMPFIKWRLYLATRITMDIVSGKALLVAP